MNTLSHATSEPRPTDFPTLVIGFSGEPGVGTTTVVRALSEEPEFAPAHMVNGFIETGHQDDFAPRSLTELNVFRSFIGVSMRQLLREHGYRPASQETDQHDHNAMRDYHHDLRVRGAGFELIDILHGFRDNIVLFEKVRNPADALRLIACGGYLIHAVAPETISDARFMNAAATSQRTSAPNSPERQQDLELAKQELVAPEGDIYASDIRACEAIATEVVNFGDSLGTTIERVQLAICRFGLDYLSSHDFKSTYSVKQFQVASE